MLFHSTHTIGKKSKAYLELSVIKLKEHFQVTICLPLSMYLKLTLKYQRKLKQLFAIKKDESHSKNWWLTTHL